MTDESDRNESGDWPPVEAKRPTMAELFRRFEAADKAWMDEIRRTLKGRPGDVRYTRAAEGDPGTPLRSAFETFQRTGEEWRAAVVARREKEVDENEIER